MSKAQLRRDASLKVFHAFKQKKVEYTCAASVNAVRDVALTEAKSLLEQGVTLSKSNYAFAHAGLMADMFLADAARLLTAELQEAK